MTGTVYMSANKIVAFVDLRLAGTVPTRTQYRNDKKRGISRPCFDSQCLSLFIEETTEKNVRHSHFMSLLLVCAGLFLYFCRIICGVMACVMPHDTLKVKTYGRDKHITEHEHISDRRQRTVGQ